MESKLILGTVQFGLNYGVNNYYGKPSHDEMKSILDFAYNQGIVFLDTAEAYGDSHQRIGNYHRDSKSKFNIITKYSSKIDLPKPIGKRIEHNLRIIDVDRLYCYMFHSYNEYKSLYSELKEDLKFIVNTGVISKLGVSVYTNNEAMNVLDDDSIQLIQLPFNLLDNFNKRKEVLLKAKERGIEVHTRSVFLQGLFFKEKIDPGTKLERLNSYLNIINQIKKERNIDINKLALSYAINQDHISKVLIGVDNVLQLQENISALRIELDDYTIQKVNKINVIETELLNPVNWK